MYGRINVKEANMFFLYSPTDAQAIVLKNTIKIYVKTAPTCFGCSHTIFIERIIRAY